MEQTTKEACTDRLRELVRKKELYFTVRCNKAIEIAVKLAAGKLDRKKDSFLLIQEEGGWITYKNQAKKNNLTPVKLPMQDGRIDKGALGEYENSVLLIHSMPGYSYAEEAEALHDVCKQKNIIMINDCCGSIGTDSAAAGDITVCSLGYANPLSAGGGGFIAADDFVAFATGSGSAGGELLRGAEEAAAAINFDKLLLQIESLNERLLRWQKKARKVKYDLTRAGFRLLNPGSGGINVLASFSDDREKEILINYCREKNVGFTECPRYIRTNQKAISIEIKRLD